MLCFFASDLHGHEMRYRALFDRIDSEKPDAVFLGGDLFPRHTAIEPFMEREFFARVRRIGDVRFFVIMGNDDRRDLERLFLDADAEGILNYAHLRKVPFGDLFVRGYSFVPPSPFRLKDWEKRDAPGKVPHMTIPPEDGITTVGIDSSERKNANILSDLEVISDDDLERTIFLCHAPPYGTGLDMVGYSAPGFDPHVGSRAIREFLEKGNVPLSLHGHIHESTTVTGTWMDRVGRTLCINGAYEREGLCLVRFDPYKPEGASREILNEK